MADILHVNGPSSETAILKTLFQHCVTALKCKPYADIVLHF